MRSKAFAVAIALFGLLFVGTAAAGGKASSKGHSSKPSKPAAAAHTKKAVTHEKAHVAHNKKQLVADKKALVHAVNHGTTKDTAAARKKIAKDKKAVRADAVAHSNQKKEAAKEKQAAKKR